MAITRSRTIPLSTSNNENNDHDNNEDDDNYTGHEKINKSVQKTFKKKSSIGGNSRSKYHKKIPAYKVEQLQRLKKLIEMSNIAKPKFNLNNDRRNYDSMKIKLSKDNKKKISNITNYNPVRLNFLKKELDSLEIEKLKLKYEQIDRNSNNKIPNLDKDDMLKQVLIEIKNDWKKDIAGSDNNNNNNKNKNYSDNLLLKNELDLKKMNFYTYDKLIYKYLKDDNNGDNKAILFDKLNKINNLSFIDVENESKNYELWNMIDRINKNPNFFKNIDEENAFEGLKLTDFASIRKFDFLKRVQ